MTKKEELIHISPQGTIRVLGVPFGYTSDEVLALLKNQDVSITRHCDSYIILKPQWGYLDLPKIDIVHYFFSGKKTLENNSSVVNVLTRVYVSIGGLSKMSMEKYFEYFKSVFSQFYIYDNTEDKVILFDTLYKIGVRKGYSEQYGTYQLNVDIDAKYCDNRLIKFENISKEYRLPKDSTARRLSNETISKKPKSENGNTNLVIVLCVIYVLVMLYLFAVNNRYHVENEKFYFDKWTETMYIYTGDKDGYIPLGK